MRVVRSDGSVIEGTPSEIAEFEKIISSNLMMVPSSISDMVEKVTDKVEANQVADDDWQFTSTDVAFRCLTRLKLSKPLRATIKLIYGGGNRWVSAASLQKAVGYSPAQFGGMMGAFGRRLINTPGYVVNSSFFDWEWDEKASCYKYRLPPSVRLAVENAHIAS